MRKIKNFTVFFFICILILCKPTGELCAQKTGLDQLTKIARLEDFYHELNKGNTRKLHITRSGQISESDSLLGYTAQVQLLDIDAGLLQVENDSSAEGKVLIVHCKNNQRCIRIKNDHGKEKFYKTYEMFALEQASPSLAELFKREILDLIQSTDSGKAF